MVKRTREREIDGMAFLDDGEVIKCAEGKVTIRVTKDSAGKTLSLQFGDIMILIPVEPVEDMIDVVEGDNNG